MLEHSMVAFLFPSRYDSDAACCIDALDFALSTCEAAKHRPTFIYDGEFSINGKHYILYFGNVRAWRNLLRFYNIESNFRTTHSIEQLVIGRDSLFADLRDTEDSRDELDLGRYRIYDDVASDFPLQPVVRFPRIITAKFTCSEGVSLEMFRHRIMAADYEPADILPPTCMSPAQESTRYVNYRGKMAFVEPHWWDNEDDPDLEAKREQFLISCNQCETNYCNRLGLGMKPQDARGTLIKDIRTEIVLTATLTDWADWYKLRSNKAAHPDMRRLAEMFREKAGDEFLAMIQEKISL